jgi:hypothetical protein
VFDAPALYDSMIYGLIWLCGDTHTPPDASRVSRTLNGHTSERRAGRNSCRELPNAAASVISR